MAKGFAVPIRPNQQGGAEIVEGAEQLRQILLLALAESDDDNPFQVVGLTPDMIFDINDPSAHNRIKQRVRGIISKFSDRLILKPGTDIRVYQNVEGEINCEFDYYDIENNDTGTIKTQVGS